VRDAHAGIPSSGGQEVVLMSVWSEREGIDGKKVTKEWPFFRYG
jgi:hypothetical protein